MIRWSLLLLVFSSCAAKHNVQNSKTMDPGDDGADPSTLITIPLDAQFRMQKSSGDDDGGADPSTLITIPLDAQFLQKSNGDDDGGADPSTLITIPLDAQLLQKSKGYGDSTDGGDDPNLITIPLDAQLLQTRKGYGDGTDGGEDPNLITIPLDAQLLQTRKGTQPTVKVDITKLQAKYQEKVRAEEQLVAKDERTIAAEKAQLEKDDQTIAYWKALGSKEETELHEMMKAEEYSANHMMDKSTSGARLIACLKTRDIAQMEGEKLQKENAKLQGEVLEATHMKELINQTLSSKISQMAAKASEDANNHKASMEKLQKEQSEILAQFAKVKEENAKIMEVKRLIEQEREQLRTQLEDITKKHEKVVKAHQGLKKAHEVLQKRHDELETRAQAVNATQLSLELHNLQRKEDDCVKQITTMNTQEKKVHETEADMRLAAFKQGTKESDQKWSAAVKNATSQRDASRYAAEYAERKAADLRATADKEKKAKDEAEVKLRQCRASREKMEIELERLNKKTGEKSSFLQLVPSDWA